MNHSATDNTGYFIEKLITIVGKRQVLTHSKQTERYRKGFRCGEGNALAVVFPQTLLQLWNLVQACVAADKIMIMQAANTGVTAGSTPDGNDYDRDVVIISTLKIKQLQLLDQGRQVVAFPGSTLNQLEQHLKPLGREPHSVIGSSCIGASIIGGICNSSGGSLIQRGPAYTEMSLFAQVDEQGHLQLINHLGIDLGSTPEEILTRLENGDYQESDIHYDGKLASDQDYARRVREVDADTPARFNADANRLYEASGCAGKVAVFAVRLDTFLKQREEQVFYIGTNNTDVLTDLRRHMLSTFEHLPVAGEYIHRDLFDIAELYGKDTFLLINWLGTDRMPGFFTLKGRIDATLDKLPWLPKNFTDRLLQGFSRLFPSHLPAQMKEYRQRYEHHFILKMSGEGITEARAYLEQYFTHAEGDFFACTPDEGKRAFLHRFAAAGSAIRYQKVHASETEDVLGLDIALRRNDNDWFEKLPAEIEQHLVLKLYCGHFMCHVIHQDYIVKKGVNCEELKEKMLAILNQRGAEYPAEHNVGHLYQAKPALKAFYQKSDPTNTFNPGIGKTSKHKHWGCDH